MREIKFRTWSQKLKQMVGRPFTLQEAMNHTVLIPRGQLAEDYHLMQYTGLQDKNGVEIYEGDILRGTSYLYGYQLKNDKQFDYEGYVEWGSQADVGLCWLLTDLDASGSWELNQTVHRNNIDYSTGEVIGNIYENPELLRDSQELPQAEGGSRGGQEALDSGEPGKGPKTAQKHT